MFDWTLLQLRGSIQSEFRFSIPDSECACKERHSQVSNATKLYNGMNDIAKFVGKGKRREHQLQRIRTKGAKDIRIGKRARSRSVHPQDCSMISKVSTLPTL